MEDEYEIYRQDVFAGDKPPVGPGWQPFAGAGQVSRASGTARVRDEFIWWWRPKPKAVSYSVWCRGCGKQVCEPQKSESDAEDMTGDAVRMCPGCYRDIDGPRDVEIRRDDRRTFPRETP